MPFYEYECKSCGHALEAMQKVSDAPLKKCPHCGKSQLMRLMSAPVFRLKGAGWYETDFKGEQDNKRNLADRPEADAAKPEAAKDDKAAADAKPADGKTAEAAAKPAEKADKPAEKAAAPEPAKKAAGSGMSKRGVAAVPARSSKQRVVKKPAPKAKRRR